VSVDEARVFASTDDCFVRPGSNLVTTPEVLAEEAALLAAVKAGQGGYAELGCGGQWKFLSPFVAGNEEQTNAVLHVLKSRDLVTSIRGPAGSGKTTRLAPERREEVRSVSCLVQAPEICVEVLSPSNTPEHAGRSGERQPR
jgi:AAA domain